MKEHNRSAFYYTVRAKWNINLRTPFFMVLAKVVPELKKRNLKEYLNDLDMNA